MRTAHNESGNAIVIALIALVVVAVGAGAYFSGNIAAQKQDGAAVEASKEMEKPAEAATQVAQVETQSGEDTQQPKEKPENAEDKKAFEVIPGNPVIAKLDDKEITRVDLLRFMQTLPQEVQQQPLEKVYPYALQQLVDNQIISKKVESDKTLDKNKDVLAQLEQVKDNIKRTVLLQKSIDERITEKRIKQEYEEYTKDFQAEEEIQVSQILVSEEAKGKELLKKLADGADFAELAKENSLHSTAKDGGLLPGYFIKSDVDKAFADIAFGLKEGETAKELAKTQFGYHIVKMEKKRKSSPVEFDVAKPQIEVQLRPMVLNEVLEGWREKADIEMFDINGNAIEPASGE